MMHDSLLESHIWTRLTVQECSPHEESSFHGDEKACLEPLYLSFKTWCTTCYFTPNRNFHSSAVLCNTHRDSAQAATVSVPVKDINERKIALLKWVFLGFVSNSLHYIQHGVKIWRHIHTWLSICFKCRCSFINTAFIHTIHGSDWCFTAVFPVIRRSQFIIMKKLNTTPPERSSL